MPASCHCVASSAFRLLHMSRAGALLHANYQEKFKWLFLNNLHSGLSTESEPCMHAIRRHAIASCLAKMTCFTAQIDDLTHPSSAIALSKKISFAITLHNLPNPHHTKNAMGNISVCGQCSFCTSLLAHFPNLHASCYPS